MSGLREKTRSDRPSLRVRDFGQGASVLGRDSKEKTAKGAGEAKPRDPTAALQDAPPCLAPAPPSPPQPCIAPRRGVSTLHTSRRIRNQPGPDPAWHRPGLPRPPGGGGGAGSSRDRKRPCGRRLALQHVTPRPVRRAIRMRKARWA